MKSWIIFLFLISKCFCIFFQDTESKWPANQKNEDDPKEVDNNQILRDCLLWSKSNNDVCEMFESTTCCDVKENEEIVCGEKFNLTTFSQRICAGVQQRKETTLREWMKEKEFLDASVLCCVETDECCYKDECQLQLLCTKERDDGNGLIAFFEKETISLIEVAKSLKE